MNKIQRKALKKLDHAFEYLRPSMQGQSHEGKVIIERNAESYAGSFLTHCMEMIVHEAYMTVTMTGKASN